MRHDLLRRLERAAAILLVAAGALPAAASSHREAPGITRTPKLDGTDFYMFTSYESGRDGFVTLVADYIPLQDAYGGPNYFTLDPDAVYDIKVDNNGDALEDLVFRFQFQNDRKDIALPIGPPGNQKTVAIPIIQAGQIAAGDSTALNVHESYTLTVLKRRPGSTGGFVSARAKDAATGSERFVKPVDNIGNKTIPDYAAYAAQYIYDVDLPGCETRGRVFVGQRKDPFVVNLGETFDLVNIAAPIGAIRAEKDDLADKNVTALVLEVPKACLVSSASNPVIGAWTTASVPRPQETRGTGDDDNAQRAVASRSQGTPDLTGSRTFVQVSRLGSPLVNELVIGLKDKDRFNASEPKDDAQFLDYVTHPTLPALLEILFGAAGVKAPTLFPRTDLVAAFLTGLDGLNKTKTPSEMLRLNTSIAPKDAASQSNLGALGNDLAGFPNGRRPGDDVVDITLRVAMGALLDPSVAPSGTLAFTDGAYVDASFFDTKFPYLRTPLPGSPSQLSGGK
ncbi:MAG TPA: DUF4331 domain-containing protein [Candidatus Sulfotelmatobacter sp.]|jgi:hypothetical protein|nr:DUF4331 domain-containing protein [Candidatus Sulfotelmatobacter sp.]